ncbi:hypothetical protein [Croceitalea rosinachiae]|uniref:Lipoprotein n=1 Tax=Croceitalea rosinachiae TaxID=3075596 RepID=A0ABU3AEY3_9FLAO|nr:hypothetical protein [Croceitalea sp. F388]MDT0608460.1 hypothetical protein [Croceitalea sp. F388]
MRVLLFLFCLILVSCQENINNDKWDVVLATDKNGEVIKGDKASLINCIRNGADIKIGWGNKNKRHSIEHIAQPIWLAILDEKEVIAHLEPQVLSNVNWEKGNANYETLSKIQEEWRVVITTKGDFDAIWYNRKEDSVTTRRVQNPVISWFGKRTKETSKSLPLYSEKR